MKATLVTIECLSRVLLSTTGQSCWVVNVLYGLQIRRMQLACVLQGPHRSSVVTAVSW